MKLFGLFYAKNQQELKRTYDAPYHMMGRHAPCTENWATDGGAIASAAGRLRNRRNLLAQFAGSGMQVKDPCNLSELVLCAYRMWGTEYPVKLEGAILTSVIDQDGGKLVLSRDRMGEMPLFYACLGSSIAFSDHPAPILASTVATPVVDREGLCEVFGLGPARTPGKTPFRDINALKAGCYLIADQYGHEEIAYFALDAKPHVDDLNTTIETVRALTEIAVSDAMVYYPGSMLSGGLDSTVLTALASKQVSSHISTYSLDYEENEQYFTGSSFQPERDQPYIDEAVTLLGTKHTQVSLCISALFEALEDAVLARGFPGMGDIDSSLLLFGQNIARHERYVLSGECGDEVFGGYPWFRREEMINSDHFPWSGSLALRESILKNGVRAKLQLSDYAAMRYRESAAHLPSLTDEDKKEARLRLIHGLCFQRLMPNLQERASSMCAASGLTVLTPYCDDRLVRYLYNVPWSMKGLGGEEKGLLRAATEDLLPDSLLHRKKSPYPKTYHPTYTQLIREATNKMLDDPASPILAVIDADVVRTLANGTLSPSETPWFGQLMAGPQMLAYLLQVNTWMAKYRVEIDL